MKIYSCLKVASEMEIPRQYAVTCRQRYITSRLDEIDAKLEELKPWLDSGGVNAAFVEPEMCDLLIEKCSLYLELNHMKTSMDRKQSITDDMIEAARNHPVSNLVAFVRGKARAWCHEDKNPSLCHMTRINKAWCPVCNKYFSPIDVLTSRDNMTFIEAVRSLQ